ncbi:hypothetical protein [Methylibium sp.]|uniref:hypothetical protein n=1 Tax=Methylibium sp. TaxID=2067992 RepID=UPI00286C6059|nr:hypothetical protein [Methylibium sp.]
MSKARDDTRAEYRRKDLAPLVRGKYYKRVMAGSNLVLLQPEIHKAFPSSEAVNKASTPMAAFMHELQPLTAEPKRAAKKRVAA